MEIFVAILQSISVFVVGLATRVAIVLALMAVLASPGLVAIGALRAWRWARHRAHAHGAR